MGSYCGNTEIETLIEEFGGIHFGPTYSSDVMGVFWEGLEIF